MVTVSYHCFLSPTYTKVDPNALRHPYGASYNNCNSFLFLNFIAKSFILNAILTLPMHVLNGGVTSVQNL